MQPIDRAQARGAPGCDPMARLCLSSAGYRLLYKSNRVGGGLSVRGRVRRRRCRRGIPALGHELVEFGLVLGEAQPFEEAGELRLLLLQPAEGFGAIFVEGVVAAGRWLVAVAATAVGTPVAAPIGPGGH